MRECSSKIGCGKGGKSRERTSWFLPAQVRRHGLRWNFVDALNDAVDFRLGNIWGVAAGLLKKIEFNASGV